MINYEIGDTVVHWTHGLGTVVAIDKMDLAGITQQYYVVEVQLFKLWVPIDEVNDGAIRFPMESVQFKEFFDILRMPGEQLPDNQYKRKNELRERMQKRTLEGLCHVIRDLTDRSLEHTLNLVKKRCSLLEETSSSMLAEEHALACPGERLFVDVAGKDLDLVRGGMLIDELEERDHDRVGLFTRRAARDPDPDGLVGLRFSTRRWKTSRLAIQN